jgi:hypothetical protein
MKLIGVILAVQGILSAAGLAALIIAGREIRRLNFGKRDNAVLNKLRATLRDARKIAAQRRYQSRPTPEGQHTS